jgi:cation transporter-like permease
LFILIPAAVGMRGVISGTTGARLGTAIAAGLFEVSWRRDGVLRRNVTVGLVLTLASSFYIAVLARLSALAFGEPSIPLPDLVTISVVGGTLGAVLVLVATIGLAVVSFRRGYDLDAVGTPMITAIGDMVTLPALFLATFLVRSEMVSDAVAILCLIAVVFGVRAGSGEPRSAAWSRWWRCCSSIPVLDVLASLLESRALLRVPRPADPDPAADLAGGRARGHPVLASVVQAPAGRDHAPRPAGAAGRHRRLAGRGLRARGLRLHRHPGRRPGRAHGARDPRRGGHGVGTVCDLFRYR